MMSLIFFLFCVFPIKADQTPVLLWGALAEEKPALQTITSQEFENIINGLLKNYMVVTFADEQLDFRTLTAFRKTDRSFFGYLRSRANKTFYMNIESPLKALSSQETRSKKFSEILKEPMKCMVGKKHIINITNEGSDDLLKHRAEKIKTLVKKINNCPVVYVYTARNSIATQHKLHRVKRTDVHVSPTSHINYIIDDHVSMAWQKMIVHENKKTSTILFTHVDIKVEKFESLINMTTNDERALHLHFMLIHGYYVLKHVDISGRKFIIHDLEVPNGMSYACNKLYGYQQSTSNYMEWHKFQIQFYKNPIKSHHIHFSEAWSCDGFFTPTIVSGLVSTAIMLAIGFCGITCMLDIHNMDRFDDPFGKPLAAAPASEE